MKVNHVHRCMRCDAEFYCLSPTECKAGKSVMPRVVVLGPKEPQIFEHVCKQIEVTLREGKV